jgi:pimeloyl-ACP methyl ester carboxylesterase
VGGTADCRSRKQQKRHDTRASLVVHTEGTGRDLFVLHGGPGFDHHYMRSMRLHEHYRCHYLDRPGNGRSMGYAPREPTLEGAVASCQLGIVEENHPRA